MLKKVIVALKPETAEELLSQGYEPIEASYGRRVVVGKYTLDHHGEEYKHLENPAKRAQYGEFFGKGDGYYVVSHLDLDSVLTIAGLEGIRVDNELIDIVSKIDIHGAHSVDWTKSRYANFLKAFWDSLQGLRFSDGQDVTELVEKLLELVKKAEKLADVPELTAKVRAWDAEIERAKQGVVRVEKVQIKDSDGVNEVKVGLAKSDSPAGFEGFYRKADIVVAYNPKFKKVTIALKTDNLVTLFGEKGLLELVPELDAEFGAGWGGRPTIIGSPRDKAIDEEVVDKIYEKILNFLQNKWRIK